MTWKGSMKPHFWTRSSGDIKAQLSMETGNDDSIRDCVGESHDCIK
jgi:hypothetical protein